jgi:signal transduction histidine kinase
VVTKTYQMRRLVFICLLFSWQFAKSQAPMLDSIATAIDRCDTAAMRKYIQMGLAKYDTALMSKLLVDDHLGGASYNCPGIAKLFDSMFLFRARELKSVDLEISSLIRLSDCYNTMGDYLDAQDAAFQAIALAQKIGSDYYGVQVDLLRTLGDFRTALRYAMETCAYKGNQIDTLASDEGCLTSLAENYWGEGMLDSARYFAEVAFRKNRLRAGTWSKVPMVLGRIYSSLGLEDSAIACFRLKSDFNFRIDEIEVNLGLAAAFKKKGLVDSSMKYAYKALDTARLMPFPEGRMRATRLLSMAFEKSNPMLAIQYARMSELLADSLFGSKVIVQLNKRILDNELQKRDALEAAIVAKNNFRFWLMLSLIAIFLISGLLIWRNYRNKAKSNTLLMAEKKKVEKTLEELVATQAQLVMREKMASLGEMTAGIAHEIQNPLNFVNNFSDLNKEMLHEVNEGISTGRLEEAKEIVSHLISNEEKINQHGKRADAIVKGMLQHSRTSSGQKELVDINSLTDEYLRLSYQGFKARDETFNTRTTTNFDPGIGRINIVPQDISRVLMNLYNNAFYAVKEKAQQSPNGYEPHISISTRQANGMIEIAVKDNGKGIPENIRQKIFQPFFTTKPTGEGTGLGLSLSYDIIKAHGGEIRVNSEEGKGSEFVIKLPTPDP